MVMPYDITERDKHILCNGLEPEDTKSTSNMMVIMAHIQMICYWPAVTSMKI